MCWVFSRNRREEEMKEHRDSSQSTLFGRLKKNLSQCREKWGPLLAAKENWNDEYNFTSGRSAGEEHVTMSQST
ncbi:hypothetical protein P175DRAFT_0501099 [Aspergillus ochraceoroseus IBT 24754]|uniref:Uncharacterized protein n=1 Tax=Aspergillus ochraceoroseus IBT 24754 TaxID=1392256 RepID=A0A2T5LW14_9EURO|nr:uncharacterized protein P175DRAFT_0501099 [Aspergillus ochraceoroseus IBT 24754]PTU20480.1 hypothetical protein P175DRAFT_0501099 [Aspergillus ochraceoroseus IBT 24754]